MSLLRMKSGLVVTCLLFVVAVSQAFADECEVCVKVVDDILAEKHGKKSPPKMEQVEKWIDEYCGTVEGWGGKKGKKGKGEKEEKLCYSISPIKRELARPVSLGMPPLKAYQRAASKDETICELKFPKPPPDLTEMKVEDIEKMRVRALKDILKELGKADKCKGCSEKTDFVDLVKKLRQEQAKAKGKEL